MIHGGQLQEAQRQFPHVTFPWIDLSTGINPYAYPFSLISMERWAQLPSIQDEENLRKVAATSYGVKNKDYVAAAPGTQILISLLPYIFEEKQVCILAPTYMEHIKTWQQVGIDVYQVHTIEAFMDLGSRKKMIGIICNPNNPDGRLFSIESIYDVASHFAQFKNQLVVDEAFMDFEGKGAGSLLPHPALTILRSFGKTYGLAGVRLGFLLSHPGRIKRVRQMLGPWAINGGALQIGLQALHDQSWFSQSKKQLLKQVQQLDQLFLRYGCQVIGGTYLFRLIEYVKAPELWCYLANHGLWVRKFDYNPQWLRFGLSHYQEWDRVMKTITNYFEAG